MGHGLEVRRNGTASFSYQGEPGWHRLGQQAPEGSTGGQMASIAGVDYTIQLRNIYTDGVALPERVCPITGEMLPATVLKRGLPQFKALTRSDNGEVFNIVSDGYTLDGHQPHDIFGFFDDFALTNGLKMETVGAIAGGSRIWALARAPSLVGRVGPLGVSSDEVRGYLLMAAGYDGGFGVRGRSTKVRVVCRNTWNRSGIGGNGDVFRMTHMAAFDKAKRAEAAAALGLQVQDFAASLEVANALAGRTCTDGDFDAFARRLLKLDGDASLVEAAIAATREPVIAADSPIGISLEAAGLTLPGLALEAAGLSLPQVVQVEESRTLRRLRQARESAPGAQMDSARGTWWGAVNALTYDADHYGSNADSRQNSAWFGQTNARTGRGFALALEMSGLTTSGAVEAAPMAMAAE